MVFDEVECHVLPKTPQPIYGWENPAFSFATAFLTVSVLQVCYQHPVLQAKLQTPQSKKIDCP